MVELELNISHDFVATRRVGTKDRDLHNTRLSPADLRDDRSVKIKSLEALKIIKIKWLVLGCIEAEFCK